MKQGNFFGRALALGLGFGLLVACAETSEETASGTVTDTAASNTVQAQLADAEARVEVVVTDSAIQLSQQTMQSADSGAITFVVQNNSQAAQELTVRGGAQGEWKSGPIAPGSNVLMSLLLQPGTYELTWPGGNGLRTQLQVN